MNDGVIGDQPCHRCEYNVRLLPENLDAWNLIMKAAPGLFGPYGVNFEAIRLVFDVYGIPPEDRGILFEKFGAFIDAWTEYMENKNNG